MALAAVLLLHGVVIEALVHVSGYFFIAPEKPDSRMTWISLPFIAKPAPPPKKQPRLEAPSARDVAPEIHVEAPPSNAITLPPSLPDAHVLGDIGRALSCNLATFDKLSEDERARCRQSLMLGSTQPPPLNAPSTLDPDSARSFAYALAEKQAPPLLPCLTAGGIAAILPLLGCLQKTARNGYSPDNNPKGRYSDLDLAKPETYYPEDRDPIHWEAPNNARGTWR